MAWQIFEDDSNVLYLCIMDNQNDEPRCNGIFRIYPWEKPGTLTAALQQLEKDASVYQNWFHHNMVEQMNAGKSKFSKKRITAQKLYDSQISRLPSANVGWLLCDSTGFLSPSIDEDRFGSGTLRGLRRVVKDDNS